MSERKSYNTYMQSDDIQQLTFIATAKDYNADIIKEIESTIF